MLIILLANQLSQACHCFHILRLLVHSDRSTDTQLLTTLPSRLPSTTCRLQRIQTLSIRNGHLVILRRLKHLIQVLEGL